MQVPACVYGGYAAIKSVRVAVVFCCCWFEREIFWTMMAASQNGELNDFQRCEACTDTRCRQEYG